jgi:hypothetical protein
MRRFAAGEPFFSRPFGAARRVARFLRTVFFFVRRFLRRTGGRPAVCAINAFTAGVWPVCVKAPGRSIRVIFVAIFTSISGVLWD